MPFPRLRRAASALAFALLACAPAAARAQAPTPTSAPSAATLPPPLDAATRRSVVDSVAKVLEARYVDAAVAKTLAASIRGRLAAGAYDTRTEPAAFGAALMRDLQSVVPDKHLRVSYEPSREFTLGPPRPPAGAPAGPVRWDGIDPRDVSEVARTNFGFDAVERLPGNVGYLRLNRFILPAMAGETPAAAMAFLANSDAVIVDLRGNPGGSPEMVELVLSYFFGPEPVRLLATYSRFADATFERRTLREVPGRRMAGADLYVLTDRNSGSSAEMFAYAVQQLRRGTVVGETTSGAGNGGAKLSVGAGLALFVPQVRVVSGPGYEGTGVAPDLPVSAPDALAAAHRTALERLAARDAAPQVKREREWALELLRASERPVTLPEAELRAYTGAYGSRTVRLEDGALRLVGSTGWVSPLVPLGGGRFAAPEARYRFERDPAGAVTALVVETLSGGTTRVPRGAAS